MDSARTRDCQSCQNYRPQTSFVDAYKEFDANAPRLQVMKSLLELRKEETHLQENEMELQLALLTTEQIAWPTEPRFAPVCRAGGNYIPAVKMTLVDCGRKDALNRQGHACRTCRFLVRPETKIGDRRQLATAPAGHDMTMFYSQLDKEQDEADAAAQAVEMEQSFFSDGCLPTARFLPTCSARVRDGNRLVPPFCNLRNDCPDHRAHVPLPTELLAVEAAAMGPPDALAVRYAIELAELVANAGIKHPTSFVSKLGQWAHGEQARQSAAAWAQKCLHERWAHEAAKEAGDAASAASLTNVFPENGGRGPAGARPANNDEPAPGSVLVPFVAGCDAYEWGLLAELSRKTDEGASSAAAVICQQLAEFVTAIPSPGRAARAIEAADLLVSREGLFAPRTIDLLDGFLRQLRSYGKTLRLTARTDLQRHFEECAAKLSYKVAVWMALPMKDPKLVTRFDGIAPEIGEASRRLDADKLYEARAEAAELLALFADLSTGKRAPEWRRGKLTDLLATNNAALDRDEKDEVRLTEDASERAWARMGISSNTPADALREAIERFAGRVGLPVVPSSVTQAKEGFKVALMRTYRRVYDVGRTTGGPSRQLIATLLLIRGCHPVTPAALDFWHREPQPGRVPETIDEAIFAPVQKTLEAFHAERFKADYATVAAHLSWRRRIGAPFFMRAGATTG
jgi:hypothetical protein